MDDELSIKRRAHEANPIDTHVAQEYEQALLRAGRHHDVVKLYELAFNCTKKWEELQPTAVDQSRYCGTCDQRVIRVSDYGDFVEAMKTGQCVAIVSDNFEKACKVLREAGLMSFARGKGKALPCVVEARPAVNFSFPESMGRTVVRDTPIGNAPPRPQAPSLL